MSNVAAMKAAYHHADLRNALIDEAISVLSESGISGLTLRELARRIGVTHTAPYAHFADKRALLEGVAEVGFARLAETLARAKARGASPEDALITMGVAYVEFAREQPALYRLMFVAPELDVDDCEMSPEGEHAFSVLVDAISALGPSLSAPPEDLAVTTWALVHGIAMLEIDGRTKAKTAHTAAELITLATHVLMRGLRS